jgi:hypothetical protein
VCQEEAFNGAVKDNDLHIFISFERRDDLIQLRNRVGTKNVKRRKIAVMAGGIAIALSLGIPAKVFADATASQPDTSASQRSPNQAAPTIQSDAQAIQPTPDAQTIEATADATASAPTASEPPTRDEIVAAAEPGTQTQTENREPDTDALFTEYQAWAAKSQAQNAVQPSQDAPTQVVDDAPAPVRPAHKDQRIRSAENSQTEIRHVQKSKARVQREQNAREQAAPRKMREHRHSPCTMLKHLRSYKALVCTNRSVGSRYSG